MRVSHSTTRSGLCVPRASTRSASRSTEARSDGGVPMKPTSNLSCGLWRERSVQVEEDAMEPSKPTKISFCTTCKNRLWQLSHTLPPNLAAIEADGCSELVLVNYNSQDELDVWIRQFRSAIEAGRL